MDQRQPFADMCQTVREVALDCGALRAVDSLAADVAEGKITDFNRAVNADAEGDEAIAFGVTQWASREAYEQGAIKMQEDKRMPSGGPNMPMDGKRMIHGGFKVILDTK